MANLWHLDGIVDLKQLMCDLPSMATLQLGYVG